MKRKLTVLFAAFAAVTVFAGCASAPVAKWVPSDDGSVVFYVMRHGKTLFNTVERAQGWSDTPLTAPGVEAAEQLGRGLAAKNVTFNAAWSSDSGRARETARLALDNSGNEALPLNESRAFRESGFGIFEGQTNGEMWGAAAVSLGYGSTPEEGAGAIFSAMGKGQVTVGDVLGAIRKIDEASKTPTGMAEDYDQVKTRMRQQLTALAEEYAAKGGGNILVVAHGISITTMIDGWTAAPDAGKLNDGQLDNASVTKVVYKDGVFTVTELNNMAYVEAGK
jgi:probable phosphoglycerate mutase